jgi:hypothetical protein
MIRRVFAPLLWPGLLLLLTVPQADACGRRCCVSYCCAPLYCPAPCYPGFALHAYLKDGPYIPQEPAAALPVRITVSNAEWYGWSYYNSEYRFYLFDEWGHYVPDEFFFTAELRTINVPAGGSVDDEPGVSLRTERGRSTRPSRRRQPLS